MWVDIILVMNTINSYEISQYENLYRLYNRIITRCKMRLIFQKLIEVGLNWTQSPEIEMKCNSRSYSHTSCLLGKQNKSHNILKMVVGPGLWDDRGRTSAVNVLGICKRTVRDKIRGVWDCSQKCRDENRGSRHRQFSSPQSSRRNLHQGRPDHERCIHFLNNNNNNSIWTGPVWNGIIKVST